MELNWYKAYLKMASNPSEDIYFIGLYQIIGANIVHFKIREKYFAYKVSFLDDAQKIKYLAQKSAGKALILTQKLKTKTYRVTKDFPMPGSIISEE